MNDPFCQGLLNWSQTRDSHKAEMQVAESTQQGTKIRTSATPDQETNVHKTVEHVSDVSEGIMVADLAQRQWHPREKNARKRHRRLRQRYKRLEHSD